MNDYLLAVLVALVGLNVLLSLYRLLYGTQPIAHMKAGSSYFYKGKDVKNCEHGLYVVYWRSGGSSLCSVGGMNDGTRWIAPTNWTGTMDPTGRIDDEMVKEISCMISLEVDLNIEY